MTWRIRDAIRRIAAVHPTLGEHLTATVRTGRWRRYGPDDTVPWVVREELLTHRPARGPG